MTRRQRHIGWLIALAFVAALLPVTGAQAATGAITGVVTSPEGVASPGATVTLYSQEPGAEAWTASDSTSPDEDGSYSFVVEEGTYRVGFRGDYRHVDEYAFDARALESADDIVVSAGETEVVDAHLGYGGVIEGRATDSYGDGIEQLDIDVYENIDGDWVRIKDVETEPTGRYRVTTLETGTYRLRSSNRYAFADTYYPDVSAIEDADDVAVTFGEATSGIDFQPAEKGRFSGLVTDVEGEALSGVGVALYEYTQDNWTVARRTVTGESGSYRIHAPHTGSYRIWFGDSPFQDQDLYVEEFYDDSATIDGAEDVSVIEHQETSGINAQIERLPVDPDPDPEPTEPPEEPEPTTPPHEPERNGLAKLIDSVVQLLRSLVQR